MTASVHPFRSRCISSRDTSIVPYAFSPNKFCMFVGHFIYFPRCIFKCRDKGRSLCTPTVWLVPRRRKQRNSVATQKSLIWKPYKWETVAWWNNAKDQHIRIQAISHRSLPICQNNGWAHSDLLVIYVHDLLVTSTGGRKRAEDQLDEIEKSYDIKRLGKAAICWG